MAKWADYCISGVRYNNGNIHIDRVEVRMHDDIKNTMSIPRQLSRADVVKLLGQGKTFVTIVKRGDGWYQGAAVNIQAVVTDYIKTTADKSSADNLENLPTF
jgi:hypothetical protein